MASICASALRATGCIALLTLAACARENQDQMSWARAALERNGQVEVVAADQQSRSFTVRVKDTGELRVGARRPTHRPAARCRSARAAAGCRAGSCDGRSRGRPGGTGAGAVWRG